ncbi:MAG TPA: chemotaxis protein CheB [Allocoleopsis sp.]
MSPFFPAAQFDVVAIAASAGGLHALSQVIFSLPKSFGAAIVVVQHLDPRAPSLLAEILARRSVLPVTTAQSGQLLQVGTIYIAPPDWHVLVNPNQTLSLQQTARVHFTRPAADILFESVANSCGARGIGIVLTGTGQDGASGIQAIKAQGGLTIAQNPEEAEFSGMPSAAIQTHAVDLVLPLTQIAPTLIQLVNSERIGSDQDRA